LFIDIEDLKPEALHVRHEYGSGELKFEHDDASLLAPVLVEFTLTHQGRELQIEGAVSTEMRRLCSRCLRECRYPLSTRFALSYLPQPALTGRDEEIELKDRDLAVGFYDGIRLDVDLMSLEQIELSMPMKFLCSDDCRGLCPKCGANLNITRCDCRTEATDSRLAALLEFRKKIDQ
jgi:uncharacterized protein